MKRFPTLILCTHSHDGSNPNSNTCVTKTSRAVDARCASRDPWVPRHLTSNKVLSEVRRCTCENSHKSITFVCKMIEEERAFGSAFARVLTISLCVVHTAIINCGRSSDRVKVRTRQTSSYVPLPGQHDRGQSSTEEMRHGRRSNKGRAETIIPSDHRRRVMACWRTRMTVLPDIAQQAYAHGLK